jgi:5-methylcytosine-specific restriction endonuclease McrA
MALSKKQRTELKHKFGGKCAYCGCELGEKWHADHVKAIYRNSQADAGMDRPENEIENNYFPACPPCNLFKAVWTVEQFRKEIQPQVSRARAYSGNFRVAERFGLIEEIKKPVVFWFEIYGGKNG